MINLFWEPIMIGMVLTIILAIVLLIGWKVNNRGLNAEKLMKAIKEKYKAGEISSKEYVDVKRELSES